MWNCPPPNPNDGLSDMKRHPLTLVIGGLLAVVFFMLLFFFQVRKSEVVVITTFGKPTKSYPDPGGPYFRLPWPIQEAHHLDQRIQNFEDQFEQANTSDSFSLLTMVYVGWRISDPVAFFPYFKGSVSEAEKTLESLVGSAKSAVVGKHPLTDFVSTNEKDLKFVEIEKEILGLVRSQVRTNNYGIEIEFLGIKKLGFPESVTQAVFDRMQSERQVLVTRTQFEGERDAEIIRSTANRKSADILNNAEAEALRIRGLGEQEAGKSFATFQQNPELANLLLQLNALEVTLKDRSTLIFDQHTPPFTLFQGISTNLLKK